MTAQQWIDRADGIVTDARDAARAADLGRLRAAVDACATFVASRTLECPREVVDAVAGAQVELSQLIVARDVASIKGRTKQFDAYLQDIERLSDRARDAADRISLKSARAIVGNVTGIVGDPKAIRQRIAAGDQMAATQAIDDIVGRLQKVQSDFEALSR